MGIPSLGLFPCAAGDGECVECGSVMWAVTSDCLQRRLKSCLALFSSQAFSFIFSSTVGWMWIWVAGWMWRLVTLMWLGAHVRVTGSMFPERTAVFASPVLFTAPLNLLQLSQEKHVAHSSNRCSCHMPTGGCVIVCFSAQTEQAGLRLVLLISLTFTLGSNGQQEIFAVKKNQQRIRDLLGKTWTSC